MTKKLLTTLGIILMIAGGFSVMTALFYELRVKPEMIKRGALVPKVAASAKAAQARQGIGVNELTQYSQDLYGFDELDRREGSLWVDRGSKKFVINLGTLNGLKAQDYLTVYDHDQKIGRVQVGSVLDVVSYAEADKALEESMNKDYYRVEKE